MLLRNIKLSGFKGIDEAVSIPLAPITLLFGGNSSGKSTILQSFLYLHEILVNKNLDPTTSEKQGPNCLLNGFENLVHKKDLSKDITFEIELDTSNVILNSYLTEADELYIEEFLNTGEAFVLNEPSVENMSLRFVISHNDITGPFLKSVFIYVQKNLFAEIKQEANSANIWLSVEPSCFEKLDVIYGDDSISNILSDGVEDNTFVNLIGAKSILDIFDSKIKVANKDWGDTEHYFGNPRISLLVGESVLSQLICAPVALLKKELKKLLHIGPVREVPIRGYAPNKTPKNWYSGLAGWDYFAYGDESLKSKVNSAFGREGFNTKYKFITSGSYQHVLVCDTGLKIEHEPSELGIGISQVFPFVTAMCNAKAKFVSIEQPELHIHPGWQLTLADLVVDAVKTSSDRMFLIETHSEALMLRFLNRVRLQEGEEKFDSALQIQPNQLSVICVYPHEGKPYYQRQVVTNDGDFELDWPEGFFEERYGER